MNTSKEISFKGKIEIIGINPYVKVPEKVLQQIFRQSGKETSPIRIMGTVNGNPYKQGLVLYRNLWRLYINTTMLKKSPERIGEVIEITIQFDPEAKPTHDCPEFTKALKANKKASEVFDSLNKSTQQEIVRYLTKLKTQESLDKNIPRAIDFLLGKVRFVGRQLPPVD
ncbi:YdeI/OmpD-associated family protein [Pseudoflavitalea sp. G-6-1-2]|uniref:YdeI/OmpD-associated family protein n=1 Tax=Pseudoflavitalea sp. G-6-1-2 TaxID=2728841 RepID=UPI001469AEB1|nr:YdeI/OmpD-associated family protein [Pseudoflavitalea sp. G-6-1-2]NML22018.1 YdeI/OmpD-associated family protein [Pseudoflavitalea sp. G-6-1-2]